MKISVRLWFVICFFIVLNLGLLVFTQYEALGLFLIGVSLGFILRDTFEPIEEAE